MATAPDAIQTALAHHQAGRLEEAEQAYRQVLACNPRHAGAMHLLGLLAFQRGHCDTAVRHIGEAIRLDADQPAFHANLGEVYRALGRLGDAWACYLEALRIKPDMAEANNNLGTLLQAEGRTEEAIGCYQRAIAARPDFADAHYNLGVAYQARQQLDEAVRSFERVILLDADHVEAHYGLGMVLQRCGRMVEAEAAYRRALQLRPASSEIHCSLGSLHQALGKVAEAITLYEHALRLRPDYAEAHYNWGTALAAQGRPDLAVTKYREAVARKPDFADAHYNLGTVLQKLGQLDEAVSAYNRAVALRPDMALAHNNLGNVYQQQDKIAEAITCYQTALRIDPRHGETLNNLGTLLQGQGRLAETVECFRQALGTRPHSADTYCNLATALNLQGDHEAALACFTRSLELDPHSPETHYNRALLYLSQERFEEGWADFAWRLSCKKYPVRRFEQPLWDGAPFPGRTLLIHSEQGFGDTLHFIRYLNLVRRLGGAVLFETQPRLLPLLKCSGFEELVAHGSQLPPFDLYAPLLALPGLVHTTLANMPCDVPYVTADERLVEAWRQKLSHVEGLKVGINWQGNRAYAYDRFRSIPLAEFAPLSRVRGVSLLSLQKGEGTEQLATIVGQWPVHDLGPELDEAAGAFMDTAAVIKNVDLVITSDTATAHLAGALGVRVWVALSSAPEWRWFLEREDSPWYPTMRLFRQATRGDWHRMFVRMAEELAALVDKR